MKSKSESELAKQLEELELSLKELEEEELLLQQKVEIAKKEVTSKTNTISKNKLTSL